MDFARRYPHLFQETTWPGGPLQVAFELYPHQPPPDHLIANVNLVPYRGDRWLILQHADGSWDLPGGTRQPGESYLTTLEREMVEEAGARLGAFELFGGWRCTSLAKKPYRPHLPFPTFYRIVGLGEVTITGPPTNPPDGEEVRQVVFKSLAEAGDIFRGAGRADLAELYQLAADIRSRGTQ